MHPRISLHQVAFLGESTSAFMRHCRDLDVSQVTLATPKLAEPGEVDAALAELAAGGLKVATVNHVFGAYPDLERDSGEAAARLTDAIALSARLGARQIYLITGGRGSLSWEDAAARFAEAIAPCLAAARAHGIDLLVENASAFNVDIHIAHTLADTTRLAEMADIGMCIDLHACWFEANLARHFQRALPRTGLVQVSDYVLGDRTAPCRAVPGDGAIPLERLIGQLLELGYAGLFDLELIGPRIETEGPHRATARAAEALATILTKLGA